MRAEVKRMLQETGHVLGPTSFNNTDVVSGFMGLGRELGGNRQAERCMRSAARSERAACSRGVVEGG